MAPLALLSVSNKKGLIPFAKALIEDHGFQIISSGGTAKLLEKEGLLVTRIADYTKSPEILDGRVKTLHPKVHGGILAKRDSSKHLSDLLEQDITPIDLVVVNLYPFQETISKPNVSPDTAIEQIDIGGPTLIRAAAKNHAHVAVLTSPSQYTSFLDNLQKNNELISKENRIKLALAAFEHTATYDIAISNWFKQQSKVTANSNWIAAVPIKQILRYGENPHQKASWYSYENTGWGASKQLQGKELSTNNLLDLESSISTLIEFGYGTTGNNPASVPAVVVIKHTNPCGVATGETITSALKRALEADNLSAFGGIVALNGIVNQATAKQLKTLFLECVVAPGFEPGAIEELASKPNLRLLNLMPDSIDYTQQDHIRSILGGLLIQETDNQPIDSTNWNCVTKLTPTYQEMNDLTFAWKIVRHVRSNAIVVATLGQSLGIGAGQMNRVGSARLALNSAGEKASGAVLASDGFFPFDDTVRLAATYGIKSIIQPGGSIKDNASITACDELGISMMLTKKRHFLH